MGFLIINWVLSAAGLFLVAAAFPGFRILDYEAALVAVGTVGLLSALVASILKQVSGAPALTVSSLLLVLIDTSLFRLSGLLLPGFAMNGFLPAVFGALVVLVLNLALLRVVHSRDLETAQ